jgi:hypothetical protein
MFVIIINIAYHIFFMNKVRTMYREKFETALTGNTVSSVKQEQIASLESELVKLRNESVQQNTAALAQVQKSILMNNAQPFITAPPPPVTPPKDSCDCEAKVEQILDKYMKNKEDNDMIYNELTPEQMQPLGSYDDTFTNKFNHGFAYLNTSKWAPPQRKTPICKTDYRSSVYPITTTGYPVDVMQYDESRKITPPDNINVNYIKKRLNEDI